MRPETRGFVFGLSLGLAALAGFGAANLQRDDAEGFEIAASALPGGGHVCFVIHEGTGKVHRHQIGAWEQIGTIAP